MKTILRCKKDNCNQRTLYIKRCLKLQIVWPLHYLIYKTPPTSIVKNFEHQSEPKQLLSHGQRYLQLIIGIFHVRGQIFFATHARISQLAASLQTSRQQVVFARLVPSCLQVWNILLTTSVNLVDIIRLKCCKVVSKRLIQP